MTPAQADARAKRQYVTPPVLAERFGVAQGKVIAWIESGELKAINGGRSSAQRPRYLIREEWVDEFEARRLIAPPPAPAPRRRRKAADAGVVEFFK